MTILYSGSGPKADQGFLTCTDFGQITETAWPNFGPNHGPVPLFWDYCRQTGGVCGVHIGAKHAEIWHWPSIDHAPSLLMTGPKNQAWYYPTLSPDQTWLAVIATPDRFYPLHYQHPGQLLIFHHQADGWHRLGNPVPCHVGSMLWRGHELFFQDRHGRLVCATVTADGVTESGRFVHKRGHSPRLSPNQQKIATRYGNHLHIGDIDIVLKGQICDHGWDRDDRLWAVLDDGFYHCQMIWLVVQDHAPITPEPADFSVPRLEQLVLI